MQTVAERFQSLASSKPDFGRTWKTREKLAEKTATVNFGCDFKDGLCKRERPPQGMGREMACCSNCRYSFGYHGRPNKDNKISGVNPDSVPTLIELFDLSTGFWRKGQGCILPRKYRSATCLSFRCHVTFWNLKNKLPKWMSIIFHAWDARLEAYNPWQSKKTS